MHILKVDELYKNYSLNHCNLKIEDVKDNRKSHILDTLIVWADSSSTFYYDIYT